MVTPSREKDAGALAARLVNAAQPPAGLATVRMLAAEAQAYHHLNPYPWFEFRQWKLETRGPYPRCMPFPRSAVRRSARWLFGKPVQITAPGNAKLEAWLRRQWQDNRMPTRMVAGAEKGGQQGGIALKFSFDREAETPLSIQTLSVVDQVRLYYHPHDRDRLLLARVQYPYYDAAVNKWFIYREEWTDAEEIHYEPQEARWVGSDINGVKAPQIAVVADGKTDPDRYARWQIATREPNPFQLIPLLPIRNLECDDTWGVGDLWGLFRVIDRVNLTYHLMDRSNQRDEPSLFFLDVDVEEKDAGRPLAPQENLSLKSDEDGAGAPRKGEVIQVEAKGTIRPHMVDYAKDLRQQVLLASGAVEVDPEAITGHGNLTQAVLMQLFAPLVELTEEKRKTYGEDGICKFLELVARGLKNAQGVTGMKVEEVAAVNPDDHDTYDVQLGWSPYFASAEDEKTITVSRLASEISQGLMTRERALQKVAVIEGIDDVAALEKDLKDWEPPVPPEAAPAQPGTPPAEKDKA